MPRSKAAHPMQPVVRDRLQKLAPEIKVVLQTKHSIDVKDIDNFVLGFAAGRTFQHEQLAKLLCPACMDGSPIVMQSGVPIHELTRTVENERGIWRKTCEAHRIYAFKP